MSRTSTVTKLVWHKNAGEAAKKARAAVLAEIQGKGGVPVGRLDCGTSYDNQKEMWQGWASSMCKVEA